MAGKDEVYKDKGRRVPVPAEAANGEVIASSESYKTKASAMHEADPLKGNAGSDVVDLTEES